jgi:hypothetical protein
MLAFEGKQQAQSKINHSRTGVRPGGGGGVKKIKQKNELKHLKAQQK